MLISLRGGRRLSPFFLFLLLFALPSLLHAYEVAPTLDRPQPFDFDDAFHVELWGQYDAFEPSLDYLNFASKSGTTSKIDKQSNQLFGINVALNKHIHVRYRYMNSTQHTTRQSDPKSISSRFIGHQFNLEYTWALSRDWHLSADVGYRSHKADQIGFTRYQTGAFTITSLNGVPFMTIDSSDSAWTAGVKAAWHPQDNFYLTLGIEARKVTVKTLFNSVLLNDGLIGPILLKEIPQRTPWNETHRILSASADWALTDWLTFSTDARYYRVSRSGYIPRVGKRDYNSNIQLDGYLFVRFPKGITAYVHGRAYQHYLLGDLPMVYNTRSNHLFKNPYGFVSVGLSWSY